MEYTMVLFVARNKDNKHIKDFKGSSNQFLMTDVSNISEKFEQNFIEYLDDMGYCDNE